MYQIDILWWEIAKILVASMEFLEHSDLLVLEFFDKHYGPIVIATVTNAMILSPTYSNLFE